MKYYLFVFIGILTLSCIDPINIVPKENAAGVLVVNGLITDQPGPYTVKLSNTANYVTINGNQIRQVIGAIVVISDDVGNIEILDEIKPGTYQTSLSGIQGEVGRTYTLEITLPNKQQYCSEPQLLKPITKIDSLYFEFKYKTSRNYLGNEIPADGFNLNIDLSDVKSDDYYLWKWTGYYELMTNPKDRESRSEFGGFVADPPVCSWYRLILGALVKFCDNCCTCCSCLVELPSPDFEVGTKTNFIGNTLLDVPVGFIPVGKRYFYNKMYVVVSQQSLSESTYRFWKAAKDQLNNT